MEELAEQLGVDQADLVCLSKSVVIGMHTDGVVADFLSMNETDWAKMCEAYVIASVKKMQTFTNIFLTNPAARQAFIKGVANL